MYITFGVRYMHMLMLNLCELCENWCLEGHTVFLGVNDITFMHVLCNTEILKQRML